MADLIYRDLCETDAEALHAIVSHWSVTRQLGGWPWPVDFEFTRSRCRPYARDGFVWGVFEGGQLRGTIGVTGSEIGYMYAPDAAGHGIATKAARYASDHAFETSDRNFLTGGTWQDNPASYRVLQKLGYEHWQTRYVRAKARGYPVLSYYLRLTRANWQRLRTIDD